jgi:hypothetical protein
MSQSSSRGFRAKNATTNDNNLRDRPENHGNRKPYEEMRIPPDDIGNLIDIDPIATFIHDGLGNSLEEGPTHLKSGILTHLLDIHERTRAKRRYLPLENRSNVLVKEARPIRVARPVQNIVKDQAGPSLLLKNQRTTTDTIDSDRYMSLLIKEFSKLLSEKTGLPFSLSMKPINDPALDNAVIVEYLSSIKNLIDKILKSALINASVSLAQYSTSEHRFAVFLVNPLERDPVRNKELISALRQIVKLHSQRFPERSINVLLVLANAESVIEGHLFKIGAKKIAG